MSEEIIMAPELAEVQRMIARRPHYLADRPVEIDGALWRAARAQLEQVLESRGWPLAADERMTREGVPHFLLQGVPVVMAA